MAAYRTFDEMWNELDNDPNFAAGSLKTAFSDDIAQAIENEKISKADLAKRVGCSKAYVTKVLRGTTNFTLETMAKFAMAVDRELHFRLLPTSVNWTIVAESQPPRPSPPQQSPTPENEIIVLYPANRSRRQA